MFWESLWSNVGKKLKIVAKVFFVLMVIGCIVGGLVLLIKGSDMMSQVSGMEDEVAQPIKAAANKFIFGGLGIILVGPIVCLIAQWIFYAAAQLVDDVAAIKSKLVPDDNAALDVKGRLKFLLRQNLISKEEYDMLSGGIDEED